MALQRVAKRGRHGAQRTEHSSPRLGAGHSIPASIVEGSIVLGEGSPGSFLAQSLPEGALPRSTKYEREVTMCKVLGMQEDALTPLQIGTALNSCDHVKQDV